jgi:hypothetical protein
MKKEIVDIVSGTTEIVNMTSEEVLAYEEYKAKADAEVASVVAAQEAKATAKQALLDKLGITAEEAQLLLGGN